MHAFILVKVFGQSEIYELQRRMHARLLKQKILKFDISVCYTLLMQIADSGHHVTH